MRRGNGARPVRYFCEVTECCKPLTVSPDRSVQSLQDRVRRELASFPKAERRVAHALLGNYPMAGLETVARFARRAQTSGPTILRFINRLGFASYADFRDALRAETQARLQSPLSRYEISREDGSLTAPGENVAQAMRQNIDLAERDLRPNLRPHCTEVGGP